MNRRDILHLLGTGLLGAGLAPLRVRAQPAGATDAPGPFDFNAVIARAADLAARPYVAADSGLAPWIAALDYDAWRKIRFRTDRALLADSRFRLQLFHPGFLFREPVAIHILGDGVVSPVDFDPDLFLYDTPPGVDDGRVSGYSGFRLHYPLNLAGVMDEVIAFQGASYFRFLGSGQTYGISARGLAIDTASPAGEEFPAFREFWIERPDADADEIVILALLDSPSVAGAWRFMVRPGDTTRLRVESSIFPRRDIAKAGIAPLTGMFLYGEQNLARRDDFRPEVHDCDGLMIHNGAGEWLWRPLARRQTLGVYSFVDRNPRGFGLLQRDDRFSSYQDLEAHYHRRPGYWVTPLGNWGEGHVELVEIPTPDETNDNIVAFWVPARPVVAGERLDFACEITALDAGMTPHPLAQVRETFITDPRIPGSDTQPPAGMRRFLLDWVGDRLGYELAIGTGIDCRLSAQGGSIKKVSEQRNPETGGLRVVFDARPGPGASMDLRAELRDAEGRARSEVWLYSLSGRTRP